MEQLELMSFPSFTTDDEALDSSDIQSIRRPIVNYVLGRESNKFN